MKSRFIASAVFAVTLASCGGGFAPSASVSPAIAPAKLHHGLKTQFIFRYGIPSSGPNSRVKSFRIGAYGTTTTHVWDIAKRKSCKAGPQCTLSIAENPASAFVVESYDGAGGMGHLLSTSIVYRPYGYQGVQLMLNGASGKFASLHVAFVPGNPQFGVASRLPLAAVALSGPSVFIVGPAPYPWPVTLRVTGNLAISRKRVLGPGQQVYLAYDGGFESGTVTATTQESSSVNDSSPATVRPVIPSTEQRTPVEVNQLAVARDGSIWASSGSHGCTMIKIQTTLTTRSYRLPKQFGCPRALTTGPDGHVWFASEKFGSKITGYIGSVTSNGTIGGYKFPTGAPYSLTTGSDGRLWATERYFGNQIYAMTTAGTFTTAPFQLRSGFDASITAGPDKNLWVIEGQGAVKGFYVVSTAGELVQHVRKRINGTPLLSAETYFYAVIDAKRSRKELGKWDAQRKLVATYPLPGLGAAALAVDRNGALWLALDDGALGHISRSGDYCELAMPPSLGPFGSITSLLEGPDGYLYYARGAAVGKIRIPE